jgi:hypothetical protein
MFLASHTRACPKCGARIERLAGCNHMVCVCRTMFCWVSDLRQGGGWRGGWRCPHRRGCRMCAQACGGRRSGAHTCTTFGGAEEVKLAQVRQALQYVMTERPVTRPWV